MTLYYAFINWTFRAFAWKWIKVLPMPEWWYTHDGEIYDMLCNLFCSGIGKNCVACIFDERNPC